MKDLIEAIGFLCFMAVIILLFIFGYEYGLYKNIKESGNAKAIFFDIKCEQDNNTKCR